MASGVGTITHVDLLGRQSRYGCGRLAARLDAELLGAHRETGLHSARTGHPQESASPAAPINSIKVDLRATPRELADRAEPRC